MTQLDKKPLALLSKQEEGQVSINNSSQKPHTSISTIRVRVRIRIRIWIDYSKTSTCKVVVITWLTPLTTVRIMSTTASRDSCKRIILRMKILCLTMVGEGTL